MLFGPSDPRWFVVAELLRHDEERIPEWRPGASLLVQIADQLWDLNSLMPASLEAMGKGLQVLELREATEELSSIVDSSPRDRGRVMYALEQPGIDSARTLRGTSTGRPNQPKGEYPAGEVAIPCSGQGASWCTRRDLRPLHSASRRRRSRSRRGAGRIAECSRSRLVDQVVERRQSDVGGGVRFGGARSRVHAPLRTAARAAGVGLGHGKLIRTWSACTGCGPRASSSERLSKRGAPSRRAAVLVVTIDCEDDREVAGHVQGACQAMRMREPCAGLAN